MKTKLKSIIIIIFLLLVLVSVLSSPKDTIDSVLFAINIWIYNVFPSLFPFFILSDLLVSYGLIELLSELFKNIMMLFGLSGKCAFPLFGSLISGFPSGAKYTKQLLDGDLISLEDANHLIMFTHYSNPLFVVGTVGSVLLNNKSLGVFILISHFLGGIAIGILFRRKDKFKKEKASIRKALSSMHKKRVNNKNSFITTLSNSIYNTIDILILLLGIIIVFLVFSNLLTKLSINDNLLLFLKGILEMTQGIKFVSISQISLVLKTILITFFLSFGGLSVHLQVSSIINGSKIKYKNFLIARIFHAFLSSILVYILFNIFINY